MNALRSLFSCGPDGLCARLHHVDEGSDLFCCCDPSRPVREIRPEHCDDNVSELAGPPECLEDPVEVIRLMEKYEDDEDLSSREGDWKTLRELHTGGGILFDKRSDCSSETSHSRLHDDDGSSYSSLFQNKNAPTTKAHRRRGLLAMVQPNHHKGRRRSKDKTETTAGGSTRISR
jgi:hypothetical protein